MSDAKPPSRQDRPPRDPTRAPAQDPADLGTAYGMEMSIGPPDSSGATPAGAAEDDPLHWIRRWLDRHTRR